jgi:hypothetical protein
VRLRLGGATGEKTECAASQQGGCEPRRRANGGWTRKKYDIFNFHSSKMPLNPSRNHGVLYLFSHAWAEYPIGVAGRGSYSVTMNTLLFIVVLLLLFGGGGFYFGGPLVGGGGLGLILVICLLLYFTRGFRTKS